MYSNSEFMDLMIKAGHGNYLSVSKSGGKKWNSYRSFEFIVYPEHFENVKDLIKKCQELKIPCCLSPLHDKDKFDDGTFKKAHYHFIMWYGGKTTIYRAYTDYIGCFGEKAFCSVMVVGHLPSAVEYQAHIENDDKEKYDTSEILGFNGFNVNKYLIQGMGDDIMGLRKDLKIFINDYNILFFNELDDLLDSENPVLAECLARNRDLQRWVKDYLKSREHMMWYHGEVEKGYTKVRMPNGTEKVIFNRQIV